MSADRRAKDAVRGLLGEADILIEGRRSWDIRVINDDFYPRVLAGGSLGAAGAFVDGWWEAPRLDQFFCRLFSARLHERFARDLRTRFEVLRARLRNREALSHWRGSAQGRGEPGADVSRVMLGRRMHHACADWDGAAGLDDAEEAGLELICRGLELKPGMTVLELGCRWGAFAKYAAERHGALVMGLDPSPERIALGRELCAGLPVELLAQECGRARGRFDRVVMLGLSDPAGRRSWRELMELAASLLKEDGLAFVQTAARGAAEESRDRWFGRRRPGAAAPSAAQLTAAMEGLFVLEDCRDIGRHYDATLLAWHEKLRQGWPALRAKHGERFYRAMKCDLLSTAGLFRAGRLQVFQLVMARPGRRRPSFRPRAGIS